jgi:hypothetical protein
VIIKELAIQFYLFVIKNENGKEEELVRGRTFLSENGFLSSQVNLVNWIERKEMKKSELETEFGVKNVVEVLCRIKEAFRKIWRQSLKE